MLTGKSPGSWLMRLSLTEEGCFVISKTAEGGHIIHQRIQYDMSTGNFTIMLGNRQVQFPSFDALMAGVRDPLGLGQHCREPSRFSVMLLEQGTYNV